MVREIREGGGSQVSAETFEDLGSVMVLIVEGGAADANDGVCRAV